MQRPILSAKFNNDVFSCVFCHDCGCFVQVNYWFINARVRVWRPLLAGIGSAQQLQQTDGSLTPAAAAAVAAARASEEAGDGDGGGGDDDAANYDAS